MDGTRQIWGLFKVTYLGSGLGDLLSPEEKPPTGVGTHIAHISLFFLSLFLRSFASVQEEVECGGPSHRHTPTTVFLPPGREVQLVVTTVGNGKLPTFG